MIITFNAPWPQHNSTSWMLFLLLQSHHNVDDEVFLLRWRPPLHSRCKEDAQSTLRFERQWASQETWGISTEIIKEVHSWIVHTIDSIDYCEHTGRVYHLSWIVQCLMDRVGEILNSSIKYLWWRSPTDIGGKSIRGVCIRAVSTIFPPTYNIIGTERKGYQSRRRHVRHEDTSSFGVHGCRYERHRLWLVPTPTLVSKSGPLSSSNATYIIHGEEATFFMLSTFAFLILAGSGTGKKISSPWLSTSLFLKLSRAHILSYRQWKDRWEAVTWR